MLILPGFYLYGRLGLFPLFIMFEEKGAMDSLGESWALTEEFATKFFRNLLQLIFEYSTQTRVYGTWIFGMPLFLLFFYHSLTII